MKKLLFLLLLLPTLAFSQATLGFHRVSQAFAKSPTGVVAQVVPYATVSVTNTATGAAAIIYSDAALTSQISPPVVHADGSGNYSYYIPLNYCVTDTISSPGQGSSTVTNICQNTTSGSGTVQPGASYKLPTYGSAASTTVGPSNITTNAAGNNLTVPGTVQGVTLTDGTASLSSGSLTGVVNATLSGNLAVGAALPSGAPAGTSAAAVLDSINGPVNVMASGAAPGVPADQATAFTNAIARHTSGGAGAGSAYVPAGIFSVSNVVLPPSFNFLCDYNRTTILKTVAGTTGQVLGGNGVNAAGIGLQGCTVDGSDGVTTGSTTYNSTALTLAAAAPINGSLISMVGVPVGTTITSGGGTTSVVMSNPAYATMPSGTRVTFSSNVEDLINFGCGGTSGCDTSDGGPLGTNNWFSTNTANNAPNGNGIRAYGNIAFLLNPATFNTKYGITVGGVGNLIINPQPGNTSGVGYYDIGDGNITYGGEIEAPGDHSIPFWCANNACHSKDMIYSLSEATRFATLFLADNQSNPAVSNPRVFQTSRTCAITSVAPNTPSSNLATYTYTNATPCSGNAGTSAIPAGTAHVTVSGATNGGNNGTFGPIISSSATTFVVSNSSAVSESGSSATASTQPNYVLSETIYSATASATAGTSTLTLDAGYPASNVFFGEGVQWNPSAYGVLPALPGTSLGTITAISGQTITVSGTIPTGTWPTGTPVTFGFALPTDLQMQTDLYQNIAPGSILRNGVSATTQNSGDNSWQVATTAYVDSGSRPQELYVNPTSTITTAATIAPTQAVNFVSGAGTITTITPTSQCTQAHGGSCKVTLINTTASTWYLASGGNISTTATIAVPQNMAYECTFAGGGLKWWCAPRSVYGPASSTTGNLTSFADTTGQTVQDSGIVAANISRYCGESTFSAGTTGSAVTCAWVATTSHCTASWKGTPGAGILGVTAGSGSATPSASASSTGTASVFCSVN